MKENKMLEAIIASIIAGLLLWIISITPSIIRKLSKKIRPQTKSLFGYDDQKITDDSDDTPKEQLKKEMDLSMKLLKYCNDNIEYSKKMALITAAEHFSKDEEYSVADCIMAMKQLVHADLISPPQHDRQSIRGHKGWFITIAGSDRLKTLNI